MSSDTAETTDEQTRQHSEQTDTELDTGAASSPLTIDLPDGSASIAEAIHTHRDILHNPSENGLAADEDISHLSEAVGDLSQKLQQSTQQRQEVDATVDELEMTVAHQQRQIQELHAVIESLMDILGTSTDWDSFDSETVDSEHATE